MHELPPQRRLDLVKDWRVIASTLGVFAIGVAVGAYVFPTSVPTPYPVEKRVEVPVERIVSRDTQLQPSFVSWRVLKRGMSPFLVSSSLGKPYIVEGGMVSEGVLYTTWFYSTRGYSGPYVTFYDSKLDSWKGP
jgi:hypothetical protein